jgi:carboxylesterase type B
MVYTGPLANPSPMEATALKVVVPLDLSSLTAYYAHIAELFRDAGNILYDVHFSKLAIQHAESHESTNDLWRYVFVGQLAQREFDHAYLTLVTMPDRTM